MKKPNEKLSLRLRPRATETVSIAIPKDTLEALQKMAAARDMSPQALLKFYVGQGLHADHLLETTAQVLSRHLDSAEEVSAIMQEIREGKKWQLPETP